MWEIAGGGVLKVAHADHDLARARMLREAEALGAIGAPAVPGLVDHGVLRDGRAWIEMERIAGTSIADLTTQGAIRINKAVEIAIAILDALAGVHAAGFVHRDLKPDNLVRRDDGSVVILDLGLARKMPVDPDDPTRAGVQVGSLEYMPPEQLLDAASVDVRADLYAFGCVLYELCTGRPPFLGDASALERAHAALRPPPLGALATVPAGLESIVHDCLAKLPARRPTDAVELRARLLTVREATPSLQRAPHSMSVIREGKQPVVLLWAELPKVDRTLLAMLAARKIAVISQRGRRVLGAVVGADHADPAGAAIAAARDLAANGARVALHLDALTVATQATGLVLGGAAAERPEEWLPAATWTGVVLTRALATVTQLPTGPSELGPAFAQLGETGETAELFGRDALLSDLTADAATAVAGAGPGFAVLVGDLAVGKSAFAAALAPRLRALGMRVHTAAIPAPGSGKTGASALAGLIGTPTGPVVRAIGDAIRAAARTGPLAIVLDDLHLAEQELLDALEYATLGGEPLPLWILGIGSLRLDQRRPGFGQRAERHRHDVLAPLDEDAAVAMTAALLKPAEYPPLRALRQIAAIARGNPLHLRSLAREIHDRGAVRTRPNGEHFLDTTALDSLPPLALGPWLAARELANLGVELVALARLCAVLGDELERDELAAVLELVEGRGGATTTVDVDVGLRELVSAGILVADGVRWVFRQALLHDGIYATTDEHERRTIHEAALELWQRRDLTDGAVAERVARHAEAVGDRRTAALAFAALGQRAHGEHRTLDADQAWQGALRNLDARDVARAHALIGRAQARYRLQRVKQALEDLDEARAIAAEVGDDKAELEAVLERATALDWADDWAGSLAAATEARQRSAGIRDPDVEVEVELAEARSLFRAQNLAEAMPRLHAVRVAATTRGHHEAETIAELLLTLGLVDQGEFAAAAAVFDELIPMCVARGDRFHLGAAYANRSWLWSAQGNTERCAEDLRHVIQLAREIGQAALERIATYNLGESLLWEGTLDEALRLAQRSRVIQRAHGEGADHFDQMLIARILAARGEREQLTTVIAGLDDAQLSDTDRAILGVLRCVADGAPHAAWTTAIDAAFPLLGPENRLEIGLLALREGALSTERRDELLALARERPSWARRLAS